jgi:hypothetical protein
MELVRELLLRLEAIQQPDRALLLVRAGDPDLAVDGHTPDEILYHLELLRERQLIECPEELSPADAIMFRGLTWEGHDLLDSIRDPKIWHATKEGARRAGGFSVDLLIALAKGLVKKKIEEHTGVQLPL